MLKNNYAIWLIFKYIHEITKTELFENQIFPDKIEKGAILTDSPLSLFICSPSSYGCMDPMKLKMLLSTIP